MFFVYCFSRQIRYVFRFSLVRYSNRTLFAFGLGSVRKPISNIAERVLHILCAVSDVGNNLRLRFRIVFSSVRRTRLLVCVCYFFEFPTHDIRNVFQTRFCFLICVGFLSPRWFRQSNNSRVTLCRVAKLYRTSDKF